jgi:hypothetical protein
LLPINDDNQIYYLLVNVANEVQVGQTMLANSAEIPVERPQLPRGKHRLCTIESLDGRTIAARRARELARGFQAEFGGTASPTQRFAIERAAALVALAEDAKARRLAGDVSVSLEDVVRTDNAAARAVKALGIKSGAPPKAPTLAEHLARRAAERAAATPIPGGFADEREQPE